MVLVVWLCQENGSSTTLTWLHTTPPWQRLSAGVQVAALLTPLALSRASATGRAVQGQGLRQAAAGQHVGMDGEEAEEVVLQVFELQVRRWVGCVVGRLMVGTVVRSCAS